jgi:hypothetical protein
VTSFGGGEATISIPYTLGSDEMPEAVIIYYIDDAGNLVTVQGAYNAETGAVEFTVDHFSFYAIGYNEVTFTDVTEDDWYYEAVTFIAARGITLGVGDDLFAPDDPITRGQFIVMLMRAYGIEPDAYPTDNFSDAGDTYYTNYLSVAKRLGISNGVGNNMYAPESNITRQDMYTLLYRSLDVLGALPETAAADLTAYSDSADIASYAWDAVGILASAGAVTADGATLDPTGMATRAQMAWALYALLSA